ncbi:4,5-DOPA dioxygenase extradiol-like [Gigantopelta aegis]|uniref:4,5-DOPA dioxygenase extradiol-like n=1 Tax=Gigantopelta aegis TaxID=1735272 RepID=UPI001B8882F7|nr:4,5-DOPA dioxygenase extradiol-like [Gigantopelta aegis]
MTESQPTIFLSHGAGPSFFISTKDMPQLKGLDKDSAAADFFKTLVAKENLQEPKAILVISAHWEERVPTVQTTKSPSLYYDYQGFPEATYRLSWPAPGAPDVALRVKTLLESSGFKCNTNSERGFDHGVFVPLVLVYPEARIAVCQLSLMGSLDVEDHLKLGEALAPLTQENVLIIGSGFTTHGGNMLEQPGPAAPWTLEFQSWLHDVLTTPQYTADDRKQKLIRCKTNEFFRLAHPRIEHFLPIVVTLAASGYRAGRVLFSEFFSKVGILEHYMF